jgi:hypothetical protein
VQRRVEQHCAVDGVWSADGDLGNQPTAEAVADPGRGRDTQGRCRVEEVVDVRLEAPGRLPGRAAVTTEIDADDAEPLEPLRERPESRPVARDAVEAEHGRPVRLTPLVDVELRHAWRRS